MTGSFGLHFHKNYQDLSLREFLPDWAALLLSSLHSVSLELLCRLVPTMLSSAMWCHSQNSHQSQADASTPTLNVNLVSKTPCLEGTKPQVFGYANRKLTSNNQESQNCENTKLGSQNKMCA